MHIFWFTIYTERLLIATSVIEDLSEKDNVFGVKFVFTVILTDSAFPGVSPSPSSRLTMTSSSCWQDHFCLRFGQSLCRQDLSGKSTWKFSRFCSLNWPWTRLSFVWARNPECSSLNSAPPITVLTKSHLDWMLFYTMRSLQPQTYLLLREAGKCKQCLWDWSLDAQDSGDRRAGRQEWKDSVHWKLVTAVGHWGSTLLGHHGRPPQGCPGEARKQEYRVRVVPREFLLVLLMILMCLRLSTSPGLQLPQPREENQW